MKKVILLSILIYFISVSCKKNQITCDGTARTYEADIKSIIDANCVSCHSSCSSYSGLKPWLDNGEFEKEVITKQTMPENSKLSEEELIKIKCWLENGAKEK